MYILGLSCLGETSAAIAKDGVLLAAVEEERFNRERHTRAFPYKAIEYCLSTAGVTMKDISYVGLGYKPVLGWRWLPHMLVNFPRSMKLVKSKLNKKAATVISSGKQLRDFGNDSNYKLLKLDHHDTHIASAFFVSPFDEAAVFTTDAVGEWCSAKLAHGKDNDFKEISSINFPNSLGFFYGAITDYLGFVFSKHEGKVMGLAAYGKPNYYDELSKCLRLEPGGRFVMDNSYFDYQFGWEHSPLVSEKFIKIFGPPRQDGAEIKQEHMDLAASLQLVVEEAGLHIAKYLHEKTGVKNLCLAGGVALNCLMNTRILQETPFEHIFVQPAANDAGTAIGAAYYIYHKILKKPRAFRLDHAYLGPSYDNDQIRQYLDREGLPYRYVEDICQATAQIVAEGNIVGWFQNRMEFGPRALGNRSILADPRREDVKEILNKKVKFREWFRPFAPAVLAEYTSEYFELDHPSDFMVMAYNIREDRRKILPGVTHADGTGRLQTITKEGNPVFHQMISEFYKLTGVAVVINTSLNIKGKPIVCNPAEAIDCYKNSGLDALVLGNYLLTKDQ